MPQRKNANNTAGSEIDAIPGEIEAILNRQENALRLLERLRADIPLKGRRRRKGVGGGRRDFRRWPAPDSVVVEIHDGARWHAIDCLDCGVAGVRVTALPAWVGDGPVPVQVTTPDTGSVMVLGDVMWRDAKAGTAGLSFEFHTDDDKEAWSEGLIEALLSRHALN